MFTKNESDSSFSLCASLPKTHSNQDHFSTVTTKEVLHEHVDSLNLSCRIPVEDQVTVFHTDHFSSKSDDADSLEQNKGLVVENSKEKQNMEDEHLFQKEFNISDLKCVAGIDCDMVPSSSTIDTHSRISTDTQDLQSIAAMQDSDISRLIEEASSTIESDMGNSVSALIKMFDTTDDKTNLTFVSSLHGISSQTLMSGQSHMFTIGLTTPKNPQFSSLYPVESAVYSAADTTLFSSPETVDQSVYTITHEDVLSPAISYPSENNMGCSQFDQTEDSFMLPHILPPLQSKPNKNWLASWETLDNCSPCAATDILPPFINSAGSSLVDLEGESQDLLISMAEYKNNDMSQFAYSLKLEQGFESSFCYTDDFLNKVSNEDNQNPVIDNPVDNFRTTVKQSNSPQAFQYADFLEDLDLQTVRTPNDSLHVFRRSRLCNRITPKPKKSLPFHSSAISKQPSPCKSKSLGDLTSEDISCNFESKYKRISRGFVASGIGNEKTASCSTSLTHSSDPLTEQLRKLVSFDQEDGCQSFYSQQNDNDLPKPLFRKLSTRSQSRVRNIASRAKERQEANKQRLLNSGVSGVVLRDKPSALPHPANRHSTGSYIAGYLNDFSGEDLEARGVPEGSCTSFCYRYKDPFCTDYSALQTDSSTADKPEIYFLLRL